MCDIRQKNGKWCKKTNAYWLQFENEPGNILTCKIHFEMAYRTMVKYLQPNDQITIKVK